MCDLELSRAGCLLLQHRKIEEVENLLLWLHSIVELLVGPLVEPVTPTSPAPSPVIISDGDSDDEELQWSPFNIEDVLVSK